MTLRSTFFAAAAAAALFAAAPSQASTNLIVNGGFEATDLAAGQYMYPDHGTTLDSWYYYGPAIANGAADNAWWPNGPTPTGFEGEQFVALQSTSVLAQTFTYSGANRLAINWIDAGRPNTGCCNGDQTYRVTLYNYGTQLFTEVGQFATTSDQHAFTQKGGSVSGLAAGNYALIFQGLSTADNTAFIDNVSAAGVPEPATWGLMIMGFGGAGAMLRRRRMATVRA